MYPDIQTTVIGSEGPDSPNDIRLRGVKTYNFDTPLSPQSQLRKRASAFQRRHKYIFGIILITIVVIGMVTFMRMIPERAIESLPSWKKRPSSGPELKRRTIELRQLQQIKGNTGGGYGGGSQSNSNDTDTDNSEGGEGSSRTSGGDRAGGSRSDRLANNEIEDDGTVCLNTVQGKDLLTDSRGVVCNRRHVNERGCCSLAIDRLSCRTCRKDLQCCHSFEYCVSCCLAQPPPNSAAYESDHKVGSHGSPSASPLPPPPQAGENGQLLRGGSIMGGVELEVNHPFDPEHFDHCLHMCRTSSRSIKHGNQYRNPLRHCYTDQQTFNGLQLGSSLIVSSKMGESCTSTCSRHEAPSPPLSRPTATNNNGGGGSDDIPSSPSPSPSPPSFSSSPVRMMCHEEFLSHVNTCQMLEKEFLCEAGCSDSSGVDQPAYVDPSAAESLQPGRCLVNKDPAQFDCDGSHPFTRRLCVCIQTNTDLNDEEKRSNGNARLLREHYNSGNEPQQQNDRTETEDKPD